MYNENKPRELLGWRMYGYAFGNFGLMLVGMITGSYSIIYYYMLSQIRLSSIKKLKILHFFDAGAVHFVLGILKKQHKVLWWPQEGIFSAVSPSSHRDDIFHYFLVSLGPWQ